MSIDKKKRHAAMEKLQADCELFRKQIDLKSCATAEIIEKFLNSTDTFLPEDQRLIFFAHGLHWNLACQVYEHILATQSDPASKQGAYVTWITMGTSTMTDSARLSFADRVQIASDVEAIIQRAGQETDYCIESTLAYFYYDHPLREEEPKQYLLKSKRWFERAIETHGELFDHHDLQTFGHVHFELGELKTALGWYEKFADAENQCGDVCVLDRKLAEKRLIECQQLVNNSESKADNDSS